MLIFICLQNGIEQCNGFYFCPLANVVNYGSGIKTLGISVFYADSTNITSFRRDWFFLFQIILLLINVNRNTALQRKGMDIFFLLYILRGFCVYWVPLPPLRCQHMVSCHPRWLPTSGLTEFAMCWGGAGFKPRTTDLQSGALPLSHLSSKLQLFSQQLLGNAPKGYWTDWTAARHYKRV